MCGWYQKWAVIGVWVQHVPAMHGHLNWWTKLDKMDTGGYVLLFSPPAILKQENIFWICLLSNEFTPSFWIDSWSCLVFSQPFLATPSGRVTECRFLAFPHWQPGSSAHFSILLLGSSYQRANSALIDIIKCWFSRKCSKFLSGANVIFKEHWWSLKNKTNLVKDTEKSFYFQCSTFWFCFFFPLRLPEAQSVFLVCFVFFRGCQRAPFFFRLHMHHPSMHPLIYLTDGGFVKDKQHEITGG